MSDSSKNIDEQSKSKAYALLENALTDKRDDRACMLQGIDQSYYYETDEWKD